MNFLFWDTQNKKIKRAEKVFKELEFKIKTSESILNIGCGKGYLENIILNKYKPEIIGVDVEYFKQYPSNLLIGDIEDIGFQDNKFDLIIFSLSLHHTNNPEKSLIKAKNLLKDRGLLFILEIAPQNNFLKNILFRTRILCPTRKHIWTKEYLISLIQKVGLNITKIKDTPLQRVIIFIEK